MSEKANKMNRRDFLGTAATAAGFMIIKPELVRGTQAISAVRFGILGVGGRGTAVGSGFVEHAGARVTALADFFKDNLDAGKKHFDELLAKLDGRVVRRFHGTTVTLKTAGARIETVAMTWRQRVLSTVAHPQVAMYSQPKASKLRASCNARSTFSAP